MARSPAFAYIGLAPQTALGVAAPPIYFYKWKAMKAGPKPKIQYVYTGKDRDPSAAAKLALPYEITFQTYLTTKTGAALLYYALSSADVVTGGGDPYTHTGATRNTALTPLTIHHSMGDGMDVVEIIDCYIETLKMSSKGGDFVMLDIGMRGGQATPGKSADTVTFDSERELIHPDLTISFTGLTANPGDVTQWDLNVKTTLSEVMVPSVFPAFLPGARDLAFSCDLFAPDNKAWRDVFFGSDAGTTESKHPVIASQIQATWSPDDVPSHQVQVTLNNVSLADAPIPFDPMGKEFHVNPSGTATVSGGTPAINLVTKNSQSAAYV